MRTHLRHVYQKLGVQNRIELEHALLDLERRSPGPAPRILAGMQVLALGFLSYAVMADLPVG